MKKKAIIQISLWLFYGWIDKKIVQIRAGVTIGDYMVVRAVLTNMLILVIIAFFTQILL